MSGGIPASALASQDPAVALVKPTKLGEARSRIARGELVELPGGLGPAWIQLMGHPASNDVEAATFREMNRQGLPPIHLHAWSYDIQRYARTMASAARDPDDPTHATAFGTLEQWLAEDDDILFACSLVYKDVRNRLDPSSVDSIPDDVADTLEDGFKKKDARLLRSSGVSMLVSWLLSGAVQLSSSRTAASSGGATTPDSEEDPQSNEPPLHSDR